MRAQVILAMILAAASQLIFATPNTLLFSVDLIRHGDRSPQVAIVNSPVHWSVPYGELSPLGMQQEYQLGQRFRARYIQHTHLLPTHYQANTLYARATSFNRTLQSAQAVLMGLYPLGSGPLLENGQAALPQRPTLIPIHSVARNTDNFLIANKTTFHRVLERVVEKTPKLKQQAATLRVLGKHYAKITGMHFAHPLDVTRLAGNLVIRQWHHQPLPRGISKQQAEQLIHAGERFAVDSYAMPEIGNVLGKPILADLNKKIQQRLADPNSQLRWVLYSTHDTTLMSVMSALGVPLKKIPHYASDLNMQLIKEKSRMPQVVIFFNGTAIKLPGCKHLYCSVKEFSHLA